jgi:hypothetical protein
MENTINYLAGLFDGEGYAGLVKHGGHSKTHPEIIVQMSDREPIDLLHDLFGGSVQTRKQGNGFKTQYRWVVTTRDAHRVARTIIPFVRIHRRWEALKSILDHYLMPRKHSNRKLTLVGRRPRRIRCQK